MTPRRPQLADVDPATLIREGRLPERTIDICLAADLVAEWEELEQRRSEVSRDDSFTDPAAHIAEAMGKLQQEMQAATITFRLRALPRRRWRELMAAHPPRKNPDGSTFQRDGLLGVHYDNFFDGLLQESIVDPQLDVDTLHLLLNDRLTDRQWEGLTDLAWNLNRGKVDIPFSRDASRSRKTS